MKKRPLILLEAFIVLVAVLLVGQFMRDDAGQRADIAVSSPSATKVPGTAGGQAATSTGTSTGTFAVTRGVGPVLGRSGTLRRFRVAVEHGQGRDTGGNFSAQIDRTLGNPRSWIAGRRFRLQRVPASVAAEFTIYLASAKTSAFMCAEGGLRTSGYTSCRLPGRVIINLDRWRKAVPGYGASLTAYRAYAINHEVGHQFGYGHEKCPGKGKPAPVMQQQTYGLLGCVANSWPYFNGKRYAGRPTR